MKPMSSMGSNLASAMEEHYKTFIVCLAAGPSAPNADWKIDRGRFRGYRQCWTQLGSVSIEVSRQRQKAMADDASAFRWDTGL